MQPVFYRGVTYLTVGRNLWIMVIAHALTDTLSWVLYYLACEPGSTRLPVLRFSHTGCRGRRYAEEASVELIIDRVGKTYKEQHWGLRDFGLALALGAWTGSRRTFEIIYARL